MPAGIWLFVRTNTKFATTGLGLKDFWENMTFLWNTQIYDMQIVERNVNLVDQVLHFNMLPFLFLGVNARAEQYKRGWCGCAKCWTRSLEQKIQSRFFVRHSQRFRLYNNHHQRKGTCVIWLFLIVCTHTMFGRYVVEFCLEYLSEMHHLCKN